MTEEKQDNQKQESSYKHIVRVVNVDIPGGKAVRIALTKIKGVGMQLADVACVLSGVDKQKKAGNLTDAEIKKLNEVIADPKGNGFPIWMLNRRKDYETGEDLHLVTGTLQYTKENDLKRLKKTKTLRGVRHGRGLPVRGQRTRSNFRKSKGKVVGVRKKGEVKKKK